MEPGDKQVLSILCVLLSLFISMGAIAGERAADKITDSEVKKAIIAESIKAYGGSCPCPYSRMKNGKLCGKRSAWSGPGGEAPICYAEEVTAEMIRQWRELHG